MASQSAIYVLTIRETYGQPPVVSFEVLGVFTTIEAAESCANRMVVEATGGPINIPEDDNTDHTPSDCLYRTTLEFDAIPYYGEVEVRQSFLSGVDIDLKEKRGLSSPEMPKPTRLRRCEPSPPTTSTAVSQELQENLHIASNDSSPISFYSSSGNQSLRSMRHPASPLVANTTTPSSKDKSDRPDEPSTPPSVASTQVVPETVYSVSSTPTRRGTSPGSSITLGHDMQVVDDGSPTSQMPASLPFTTYPHPPDFLLLISHDHRPEQADPSPVTTNTAINAQTGSIHGRASSGCGTGKARRATM